MAAMAEKMVGNAVDALANLDWELAESVLQDDDHVDRLDLEIEERCIRLLALQQPTATDLRVVGSAMKIITDIERIGDLAVDIAKTARKIDTAGGTTQIIDLPKMGAVVRQMFREAIESYINRDIAKVEHVAELEDQVDLLYKELRGQLFRHMDAEMVQLVSDGWLLLSVHHLERIADHALNIAERVGFIQTGVLRQLRDSEAPLA